ncbi:hypothetical protein AV274_5337 [Blastocystis sp. ATCC 50177/Nand II]|uniref:Uncharacterized protein n=1 Tax=Blastocystis sp. subtype 1 (strain ATCC 50177 / NandII) TaxID=478820 RepID=A0A196S7E9_BLAHN|nr:hypothetical protein AV274_5337 [Blastocystis sp. ATCC 50177/Nand II]
MQEPQSIVLQGICSHLRQHGQELLHRLQQEQLLLPTATVDTVTPEVLADLVDFIQNQLALISSSTAITCATAKLAPLRGALQAAVALHAVVIVCAGLRTEQPEEVSRMEQYLREISANDSYLRILPEPVLALFASIEEALEGMVDGSLPQPAEASPTEEHPVDPVDTATIPEDHPRETPCDCSFPVSPTSNTRPPTVEDDHPPTTIIIDESLLQQRELLRTLEVQYGVSYVCRSVRPLSMVVDVDTGVLLTSLLELLDATRLRAVVNSLAGETDCFYQRDFLTEEETEQQRWYSTIPFVNPFVACFINSAMDPDDLCELQTPNPWLSNRIVSSILQCRASERNE